MSEKGSSGFSRRNFIKTLGIVTGAAAVAPLAPSAVTSAVGKSFFSTGGSFKVGLIIRRGSWTTDSILSGISLYLKEIQNRIGGKSVELVIEEIGNGAGSLIGKTTKLIEKDKVDVVIAQANSHAAGQVRDYVDLKGTTFIEMSAGEVITAQMKVTPNYFRSTLNLWQAHAAMGAWAAENVGKKAAIMTSFNNSGYDFHRAFALGFDQAGGHAMIPTVTGSPTSGEHPLSVMSAMRDQQIDLIYGSYADQSAIGFTHAYTSTGSTAPVFGTDFRESSLRNSGNDAKLSGGRFASSWSPSLEHPENRNFQTAYASFAGRAADEYAVLGYDTIRVVLDAAKSLGAFSSLSSALTMVGSVGPRGPVRFDKNSHTLFSQVYLCDSTTGNMITELDYSASTRATSEITPKAPGGMPQSGWTSSYLAGESY